MSIQYPGLGSDSRPLAPGDKIGPGEASLQAGLGAWASAISADDNAQAAIALAEAINRARDARTNRDNRAIDARVTAVGRLETLRARLAPVYAAIPRDVELFDLGMVGHDPPRLFIDIIAFVELADDRRSLRLIQETRTGRILIGETTDDRQMTALVTHYIAERLVERERALAANGLGLRPQPLPRAIAQQVVDARIDTPSPAATGMAGSASSREQAEPVPALNDGPSLAKRADMLPDAARTAAAPIAAAVAAPLAAAAAVSPTPATPPAPNAPAAPAAIAASVPIADPASKTAGLQAKVATGATQAAMRQRSGGWLWPILALVLGVGIGALALYLYALSLNRI